MPTILVVDDEKNIRATLSRGLRLEGFATLEAADGAEALARLDEDEVDLLIVDLQMPVLDGLGLLEELGRRGKDLPALVLTAHGTIEKAVRAVRLGAADFIEKPPAMERILVAVRNALRVATLERENRRLAAEAGQSDELLGTSRAMAELRATIASVAVTDAGVLVSGENGSGKELVARALHAASPRRTRPLVTVNCAAIPEALFESELFGHARGAFTGATDARHGKFQRADGGTLFLDEVGELPAALQPKLLRALESGDIERVGGRGPERVDVRLVAATNRDLEAEMRTGRFREDLYYRLLVVPIRVPPLRERTEDVPLLARHFLDLACRQNRVSPKRLSTGAEEVLLAHGWPGNVRELRNAMGRVAILVPDPLVRAEHVAFLRPGGVPAAVEPAADLATEMTRHERAVVLRACERHHWRMSRAAEELGLERSHLYKKLKAMGIERPDEV